jgi:hypothetical protein
MVRVASTFTGRPIRCYTTMPLAYPSMTEAVAYRSGRPGTMPGGATTAGIKCVSAPARPQPANPASSAAAPISRSTRRRAGRRTPGRHPAPPGCATTFRRPVGLGTHHSSMTHRAIRQIASADMIEIHPMLRPLRIRRLMPFGVEDRILRPQLRTRVAMAGDAELHRERPGLRHQWHAIDCAMTARASDVLSSRSARRPIRPGGVNAGQGLKAAAFAFRHLEHPCAVTASQAGRRLVRALGSDETKSADGRPGPQAHAMARRLTSS